MSSSAERTGNSSIAAAHGVYSYSAFPITEGFVLVVGGSHPLAGCKSIHLPELRGEALLMRTYCEHFESLVSVLRSRDFAVDRAHEVHSERDLEVFLEQGLGVAFAPKSVLFSEQAKRVLVTGLDLRRTVSLVRRCRPATDAMM